MTEKAKRITFSDSFFDIEKGSFPTELEDAAFKGCRFHFRSAAELDNDDPAEVVE